MAVTSVNERRSKRSGLRPKGAIREYRRVFLVTVDSASDGVQAVLESAVPQALDPYEVGTENDFSALVVDRKAQQERKSPLHWNVEVFYSTDVDKQREETADDPLSQRPVISFGFERFRVIAVDGFRVSGSTEEFRSAIVNSSKQPFDPPPMMDESRPVLTVIRNEAVFASAKAVGFQDAVNNAAFAGADEGQVKVQNIAATQQIDPANPEVQFWRVTYTFAFKKKGWSLKLLDHGTRIVDPDDVTRLTHIPYTEDGVVTDVLLNGNGDKLRSDLGDMFLEYEVYDKKDFAELGLNELLGAALEPDPPAQPEE